jgi:mono/diheme cytochrome c family protein
MLVAWCVPLFAQPAPDAARGRATYEAICAACHGPVGRLPDDSPLRQAFDPVPADFTDPLFNSREPATDWERVVLHGGAASGLSAQMPAQQGTLSEGDVRDVVAYVKTLAETTAYPPGETNFFLPIRTKKAFPEDEVVWKSRRTLGGAVDAWRNVLEVEKRVGARGQWLAEAIYEARDDSRRLEEVEVGYKHTLAWSMPEAWILSGAMVFSVPTRSEESIALSPYLAWGRRWSPRWITQASVRLTVPFDQVDDGRIEVAGAMHYDGSDWPRRVFPALEIVAGAPFRDPGAGDRWQFSALPQVRIGLTKGGHVAVNLGVELPLSDQPWDRQYHLVLLWDFADGSLFKGW